MISKTFYVAAMSVRAGRTCPSDVCRRLPSDPVSRRTPLPLAVSFPQSGRFGNLRPLVCVRAGRTLINPASDGAGGKGVILILLRHARGGQDDVARGPRRRAALHGGPVLCASQAVSTCPRAALAGGPRLCADGDDRGEQRRQTHSCPSAAKRPDERFC